MKAGILQIRELTTHKQEEVRAFQINHLKERTHYRTKQCLSERSAHVQAKKYAAQRAAGQTDRAVEPPPGRRHRSATTKQAGLLERQRATFHGPARAVRQGRPGCGEVCEPDRRARCAAWGHG